MFMPPPTNFGILWYASDFSKSYFAKDLGSFPDKKENGMWRECRSQILNFFLPFNASNETLRNVYAEKRKKKEKEPQAFYTFWEKCSNMCDLWFSHVGGNLLISKHNLELNLYM